MADENGQVASIILLTKVSPHRTLIETAANKNGEARIGFGMSTSSIILRIAITDKELIGCAAAATGKSLRDFIVETACHEARAVLFDRCRYFVDEDEFSAFEAAIDQSPTENPQLRRLMRGPAHWD